MITTTNPSCFISFIHILLIIISTVFMILNISSSQPIEFIYNGFNGTSNRVVTDGSTEIQHNGALRLTDTKKNVIGHAFYPSPIPMINKSTNSVLSSFSTYFVFQVNPSSGDRGGYGLAFTLSPYLRFFGAEPNHYMGVFNSTNDGNSSNHIFLVEFDTVNGYKSKSDSEGNHIGVNINGMQSNVTESAQYSVNGTKYNQDFNLESRSPIQAWIDYQGEAKLLNVTVCPINIVKPSLPLISEIIDLSSVVRDNMYVGFSSATGEISSSHYILGWSFNMNGMAEPLDLTKLPIIMEIESTSNAQRVKKALVATFSVLLFVLVSSGSIVLYRRVMKFEDLEDWELECPRRFRYRDLHKAAK